MFLDVYGAALAIVLGSVLLGRAVCVACGGPARWWAAPAVGLASLIVLEGAAIKLPGRAVTADVVGLVVLLGAAAFLLRRRRAFRVPWGDLAVGGPTVLAASIPFFASGRIGLQGVSLDNDTAAHLLWAEALRSPRMAAFDSAPAGYPLGPHSLVAALGTASGIQLDAAFAGLLLAIVPITALVAAGVVAEQRLWRRVLVGLLCSSAYLVVAYYGEGAFKETIMAALLLGFVVHLGQVQAQWSSVGARTRWLQLLPAVLLVAGAVYNYSYLGLAWFGACVAVWGLATVVSRPGRTLRMVSRRNLARGAPWAAAIAVLAVIVLLPIAGQLLAFIRELGLAPGNGSIPVPLGNLAGTLSPYEMFGIWLSPDFRHAAANGFHSGEVSALALGVLIYGVIWSLRRRDWLMPAAVGGSIFVWLLSRRTHSPYTEAKALVIASPLIMAVGLRALLTPSGGDWTGRSIRLLAAALFCGFAAYSSFQSLRDDPVQAPEAGRELSSFHRTIGDSTVLFLGSDEYARWQLRDSDVLTANSVTRGGTPVPPNTQADFNSVDPADLDRVAYVITSNTPYATQPYSNFRLVASERLYSLWERRGPTTPRAALGPLGEPGTMLDCRSALGRKLHTARGVASLMPTPVAIPGPSLPAGARATFELPLPRGRWELSIKYISSFNLDLTAAGAQRTMPAYLGQPGPFFAVGAVTTTGATAYTPITIQAQRPSFLTSSSDNLYAAVTTIAATRIPDTRHIVPLRDACGKYVDWYRLS